MPKPVGEIDDADVRNRMPLAVAKLVRMLQEGQWSCLQMAKAIGMSDKTVQRYCRALHAEHMIHIAAWVQDTRGFWTIRIYKLGPGEDAAAPNVNRRGAVRVARRQRLKQLATQPKWPTKWRTPPAAKE